MRDSGYGILDQAPADSGTLDPCPMPRFSPRQLIVVALLAALILGLTLYRTFRPL
jgi:hypothetical protein